METKTNVVKMDNVTIAYVNNDSKIKTNVNLGLLFDKEQIKVIEGLSLVPSITDGSSKTKKNKERPEFCKGKYLVTLQIRSWTKIEVANDVDIAYEILESVNDMINYQVFHPGMKIKFHAIATEFTNNYGHFISLTAKGVRILMDIDETIANNECDLDF